MTYRYGMDKLVLMHSNTENQVVLRSLTWLRQWSNTKQSSLCPTPWHYLQLMIMLYSFPKIMVGTNVRYNNNIKCTLLYMFIMAVWITKYYKQVNRELQAVHESPTGRHYWLSFCCHSYQTFRFLSPCIIS